MASVALSFVVIVVVVVVVVSGAGQPVQKDSGMTMTNTKASLANARLTGDLDCRLFHDY